MKSLSIHVYIYLKQPMLSIHVYIYLKQPMLRKEVLSVWEPSMGSWSTLSHLAVALGYSNSYYRQV